MDADEVYKMQFDRAVQSYLQAVSEGLKMAALILLADLTAAGFAVANKTAGILLAASVFPLAAAYSFRRFVRFSLPFLYAAFVSEDRLLQPPHEGMARTFVGALGGKELVNTLSDISSLTDERRRFQMLRSTRNLGDLGMWRQQYILVAVATIQIPGSILLSLVPGWRLV